MPTLLWADLNEETFEEIEAFLVRFFELQDPVTFEVFDWGDGGSMGVTFTSNNGESISFGTGVWSLPIAKGNQLKEIFERSDDIEFWESLYIGVPHWSKGDGIKIERGSIYQEVLTRLVSYKALATQNIESIERAKIIVDRIENPKRTNFVTMGPRNPDHPDHENWLSEQQKRYQERDEKSKNK